MAASSQRGHVRLRGSLMGAAAAQRATLRLLLLCISIAATAGSHHTHPRKHAVDETAEDDDHAPDSAAANPWFYVRKAVVVLVATLALLYAFLALAVTCEDYLVPCIECVCAKGKLPDEAAGALLLAFGSSAPEIMMNATATLEGETDLSLPAVLGSAMFAFGMIPAACTLLSTAAGGLRLAAWPIIRDMTCYFLALALLCTVLSKPHVNMRDALLLCCVYLGYVAVVLVPFLLTRYRGSYYRPGARDVDGLPVLRKLSRRSGSGAELFESGRQPSTVNSLHSAGLANNKDAAPNQSLPSLVEAVSALASSSSDENMRHGNGGGSGGVRFGNEDTYIGSEAKKSGITLPAAAAQDAEGGAELSSGSRPGGGMRGRIRSGAADGGTATAATSQDVSRSPKASPKGVAAPAIVSAAAMKDKQAQGRALDMERPPVLTLSPQRTSSSGRERRRPKSLEDYDPLGSCEPVSHLEGGGGLEALGAKESGAKDDDGRKGPEGYIAMLGRPVVFVMDLCFPDMDGWIEEISWWRIIAGFVMSLVWVGIFSNVSLLCTSTLATELKVPNALAGATLLALGSQVPDTIASVSMSRAGMADGAISNAIGSQVINVSVGLGIPFVMYNALRDAPVPLGEGNAGALLLGMCTVAVMVMYACASLPITTWLREKRIGEARITRTSAIVLFVGFSACYTVFAVRGSQIDF